MFFQAEEYLAFLMGAGAAVLLIAFIILIVFLIIWLKIWAWAIQKQGGSVSGLGQVFLTLILASILSLILEYAIGLVIEVPLLGFIIGLVIQVVILAKRHDMEYGSAVIAIILVWIIGILVGIVLGLILILIIIFGFGIAFAGFPF